MNVAFLSCHLTGTGHLVRTLALAQAVSAHGGRSLVLSGGRPLPHLDPGPVELVQLPPVTVPDFDFSTLRRLNGVPADGRWMASRRHAIGAALDSVRPDALVTETFPLGRRMLADEFEAAVACARYLNGRVAILASVRDVPEPPRKPARLAEAGGRLCQHYDRLMVHGDPDLIALDATWPLPAFAARTDHTGYVAAEGAPPARPVGDEVLVSVGGGVLGRRLLAIAAEASRLSTRPWRLLTGGADAEALATRLAANHPHDRLAVEPARPDYRTLLASAAVSVSLAGYNTVTDLARTDTPAILVPFAEHDETEQTLRATALARFPGLTVLRAETLDAPTLAQAVEVAAAGPRRPALPLRLEGAATASRLIARTVEEKRR